MTQLDFAPSQTIAPRDALDGVLNTYWHQGHEAGYRRAVSDLLSSLVLVSERFIARHPDLSDDLRKTLYKFEEHWEQEISRLSFDPAVVEGGLGI